MRDRQVKLTLLLAALALAGIAITGGLAERQLARHAGEQLVRSLEERAALARELAVGVRFEPARMAELDALADRAGAAAGARVTFVAPDGTVVGDSRVPLARLPGVENHAARPEIQAALAGGVGQGERHSGTVGEHLAYVAIPVDAGRGGVVRVAVGPPQIEAAAAELRLQLGVAALLGLLAAGVLAHLITRAARRPLREIQELTRSLAAGDLSHRIDGPVTEDFREIAASIQRLAEQLRERLAEATQEKERLQAVLDGMVEGVLVIDATGAIVLANDRVRKFFGIESRLIGRTPLEGIRHAELAELLVSAEAASGPQASSLSVVHPAPRTLRVHAVRFPAGAAEPLGTVAVFHDVTEVTQLERMRREFVANASHELRTPLAAIRGFAETLIGSPDLPASERRNYLEVIDRHSRRLGHLVADLLELSKIESGELRFQYSRVDTRELTEALIRDNAPRFAESGLETELEVKGTPVAWADATAVDRILTNLLDNAIQYTESGGRIRVLIESDDRAVHIRVEDTGIGIPEADLSRIFERFYRVDRARSRAQGGTGLGLAIVKHLAQGLGGDIEVQSQVGVGSTFRLSLPRA